jgi:hypothetical protein
VSLKHSDVSGFENNALDATMSLVKPTDDSIADDAL